MAIPIANFYTRVYAVINRSGLLNTTPGRILFRRAYFAYKMLLEDPFYKLAQNHPEYFQSGDIIDVGANIGYCTWIFRNACDEGCSVHSFEPAPNNFRELERYFGEDPKVILHHSCVGEKEGTISLWLNSEHHADNRTLTEGFETEIDQKSCIRVPCISLDEYVHEDRKVALIKIDVQGVEELVFRGMTKLVERDVPNIVFEYCPSQIIESGFQPSFLTDFFRDREYILHEVSSQGKILPFSIEKLKKYENDPKFYTDILATRKA